MFTYNINDKIKVKLTDKGKEILAKEIAKGNSITRLPADFIPSCYREDNEGYIHPQLWDFMRIFGSHFWNGCPQVIENNEIIFIDEVN